MPFLTPFKASMMSESEVYLAEWTNSSRLLFYSVIFIAIFTLPVLAASFYWIRWKTHQNPHFVPYLSAILAANMVMLGTLLGSVITENSNMVYGLLPGFLLCKTAAFLVNTSSCFIHWSWVAMYTERFCYIVFPFRFHYHKIGRTRAILCTILLGSMCIQLWTPIFITGRRLENQMDNIYCGEDPSYSSNSSQLVMVLEVITTFFIPLILTILADISVLTWKSAWGLSIHVVSQEEIMSKISKDGSSEGRRHSNMKIVSMEIMKKSQKRRSNAIRRCLISATITLFLNLPNYSLQVLDEFLNWRDSESIDVRRIFLRIDALVYILYLMQFPITPIHIYILMKARTSKVARSQHSVNMNSPRESHHQLPSHHGFINHI